MVPSDGLTGREREVFRLLQQNWRNVDIAEELGISGKTLDTHLQSIGEKLGGQARKLAKRVARHSPIEAIADYEPSDSYTLFSWNAAQATRHDLRVCKVTDTDRKDRVRSFFPVTAWQTRVSSVKGTGRNYWLTGLDYDDLDESKAVVLAFTPVNYVEAVATQQLFNENRRARRRAERILKSEGARAFVTAGPPNNTYMNVSVVDSDCSLLALRRGSATYDLRGAWTLGGCETFRDDSGDDGEVEAGLLSLEAHARKTLRKEMALEPPDYGQVSVSWIGVNYWVSPEERLISSDAAEAFVDPYGVRPPCANVRIHAQVRANIPSREIWRRMQARADDRFEHDAYAALPWTEEGALSIINAVWRDLPDAENRRWAQFAALAARELDAQRANLT